MNLINSVRAVMLADESDYQDIDLQPQQQPAQSLASAVQGVLMEGRSRMTEGGLSADGIASNNAGAGQIDGIGSGQQGEPGGIPAAMRRRRQRRPIRHGWKPRVHVKTRRQAHEEVESVRRARYLEWINEPEVRRRGVERLKEFVECTDHEDSRLNTLLEAASAPTAVEAMMIMEDRAETLDEEVLRLREVQDEKKPRNKHTVAKKRAKLRGRDPIFVDPEHHQHVEADQSLLDEIIRVGLMEHWDALTNTDGASNDELGQSAEVVFHTLISDDNAYSRLKQLLREGA